MSIYDSPKINFPKIRLPKPKKAKDKKEKPDSSQPGRFKLFWLIVLIIFLSCLFGFLAGLVSVSLFYSEARDYLTGLNISIPGIKSTVEQDYSPQISQEKLVIEAVEKAWPTVVSIVITKDVPIIEQYFYNPFEGFEFFFDDPIQFQVPQYRERGTEKREIGGGTGFIISEDGLILTNKHVVFDQQAEYTVFTSDGQDYQAEVIARDLAMDIAVLKIEKKEERSFPFVDLGDSDKLRPGQTVIAIGTALGEFRNTVSMGVVSGLGRTITASGGGMVETLEDIIQTDAAINRGNSGGPLLNLKGEVVGINTAMVLDAQNIGFAIPINQVKKSIDQVKQSGEIVYPFLGVRYVLVNDQVKQENNLLVDYGALIIKGSKGESAIYPDSAADQAGLMENDIILEFDNQKITIDNPLAKIIMEYSPGDQLDLKILRNNQELIKQIILKGRKE
jgi:S1-C subfamily serine protease